MTEPTRADRLSGAVWGHLIGDAMGVPYEFRDASAIGVVRWGERGTYEEPPGTWSDDGALMLALLDSLLDGFDTTDQAARFLDWHDRAAYTPDGDGAFDVGTTTRHALDRIRDGVPPEDAGPTGGRSQANGSLMRILPIALTAREPDVKLPELVARAQRASRVTHGHVTCQVACALYVVTARDLLRGDPDRGRALEVARRRLRLFYAGSGSAPRSDEHLAALDRIEAWTERAGRGGVIDSFWSAWDAFAGAASYRETIERAIGYGNDTDTTAAIAGGLSGIYWGIGGIPPEWLDGMRGHDLVDPLVERLRLTSG